MSQEPRTTFRFSREPTGALYRRTLSLALGVGATKFGLIWRTWNPEHASNALRLIDRLQPSLEQIDIVSEYPGSQLASGFSVHRHLYAAEPDALAILQRSADSLYDWVGPHLPEDLHFLRQDGSSVLVTVAQEEDAWFLLHESEFEFLADMDPEFAVALHRDENVSRGEQ